MKALSVLEAWFRSELAVTKMRNVGPERLWQTGRSYICNGHVHVTQVAIIWHHAVRPTNQEEKEEEEAEEDYKLWPANKSDMLWSSCRYW